MTRLLIIFPLLLVSLLPAQGPSRSAKESIRGITISTHGIGFEWAEDRMIPTMKRLRDLGARWVAIHPYVSLRDDGSLRPYRREDPPTHVTRPIAMAHELGLKILIKPHIAYWRSRFSWRGDIAFEDEARWKRFFADYERWIVEVARVSKNADGFVVGTELDRTLHRKADWDRVIREIRGVTKAPLTYAANWPDYERVPFWDRLDVIGIQAYFPLSERRDVSADQVIGAWRKRMDSLTRFAKKKGKDIVFTELGYNQSLDAPVKPWDHKSDGPEARKIQSVCLDAALRAIETNPHVLGSFLWKWFPEPRPAGRNFRLADAHVQRVIREAWKR